MYRVVHDDKEDSRRRYCHVGMPAVQQDGNVMVPMQENQVLFVNDNEEGIQQLTAKGGKREIDSE